MKTPRITVTANQDEEQARNTRGESQKSEEHFRKIVDKSANATGQGVYSKKKK